MVVRAAEFGYVQGVSEFIDINGASGAKYRFRRIDGPMRLPATAGNFIFMRACPGGEEMIGCGAVSSLARAATAWSTAAVEHQADTIYIRLNVSRTIRAAEHEDIVAEQAPVLIVVDRD